MNPILDTSIQIATDVPPLEGELAISAVTLAELHFAVLVTADADVRAERLYTRNPRDLAGIEHLIEIVPV